MEFNPVSLNNVILNISSPANREIVFKQGEILRGVVQEIGKDGASLLLINGQIMEATAEAEIQPGQLLQLLVEEVRPGRISLKVLTAEALQKIESSNLAAKLQAIGITPREDNLIVARSLLANNLPVNPKTMGDAVKLLNRLGGLTADNLNLSVLAVKNSLPASPAIILRLATFFKNPDMAGLCQQLEQVVSDHHAVLTNSANVNLPAADPKSNAAVAAHSNNNQLSTSPSPDRPTESVPLKPAAPEMRPPASPAALSPSLTLKASAATQGQMVQTGQPSTGINNAGVAKSEVFISNEAAAPEVPDENMGIVRAAVPDPINQGNVQAVRTLPIQETALAAPQPAAAGLTTAIPGTDSQLIARLLDNLQGFIQLVSLEGKSISAGPAGDINQLVQNRSDLITGFINLESILDRLAAAGNQEARELLPLVKELEQELSGQQIVNTAVKLSADPAAMGFYIAFPFKLEQDKYSLCQLSIKGNNRRFGSEQESLRLAVSLDTPQMGLILCHLEWHRSGQLNIQGVVENQPVYEFLNLHWHELTDALAGLGYQVSDLGLKVTDNRTDLEVIRPTLDVNTSSSVRPIGIDVVI